jgi:hypothetical protein
VSRTETLLFDQISATAIAIALVFDLLVAMTNVIAIFEAVLA